jgi:hypothetical protein
LLLRGWIDIGDAEGFSLADPAFHALAQQVTVIVDRKLAACRLQRRNARRSSLAG